MIIEAHTIWWYIIGTISYAIMCAIVYYGIKSACKEAIRDYFKEREKND